MCYIFLVCVGQYLQFVWDYKCFSGIDYIENLMEDGVFKIVNDYIGEGWNEQVDDEFGNFDYLMGVNIDFCNYVVIEEIKYWVCWVMEQIGCDGFCFDVVKYIFVWFYKVWIEYVQEVVLQLLFIVVEYWFYEVEKFQQYIDLVEGKMMLFDVLLQMKFYEVLCQGCDYDMSQIFSGMLVEVDFFYVVILVINYDMQLLQVFEVLVEFWFKFFVYVLILLWENGVFLVFYVDFFGVFYEDIGGDGEIYVIEMFVIE